MFVAGQCVNFGSNSSISAEIHHNIGVQANMNSFSHFVLCVVLCLYTIAKIGDMRGARYVQSMQKQSSYSSILTSVLK